MQGFHINRLKIWRYSAIALMSLLLALGLGDRPLLPSIGLQTRMAIAQPASSQTDTLATTNPGVLVQQGVTLYEDGNYQAAIEHWNTALTQYEETGDRPKAAIVLENLARTYQHIGQTEQSIDLWEQAIALYHQINDAQQVGRLLSEQAQSYSRAGQYRQALSLLCGEGEAITSEECTPNSAIILAEQTEDVPTQIAAWGSLGETYRLMGNFEKAEKALNQGLDLAQRANGDLYLASLHTSLGNIYINQAQDQYRRSLSAKQAGDTTVADGLREAGIEFDKEAIAQFQAGLQTLAEPSSAMTEMRLLVSLIRPAYRVGKVDTATTAYAEAIARLPELSDSQEKVYAAINLAALSTPTPSMQDPDAELLPSRNRCASATSSQARDLLQIAIAIAQTIGDRRSESFALGAMGQTSECRQDYADAIQWTQQARWAAEQGMRSSDSLYLWEWQTGRILKAQGKEKEAIALYEQAIRTLELIRGDLLIANQDAQFNFRDSVDPLYRELIALRLNQEPVVTGQDAAIADQRNVEATLRQLDSLKLAELQNYFGDDCVIAALNDDPIAVAEVDQTAAIFSSIVLNNRTAIVVRTPEGQQLVSWIDADSPIVRETINQYRKSLERYFEPFDSQYAETVYDWIVAPFIEALRVAQVNTLVFVQDDIFRSVPMAALYDKTQQQFLIEEYAIATIPSLTLTSPDRLEPQSLRALAIGLSEDAVIGDQRFQALENVEQEILAVQEIFSRSLRLLNQEFTYERLQQELNNTAYSVIHIATHGKFGAEPENTFIVTGNEEKLTMIQLDTLLRNMQGDQPVELLSLTACETAVGDNRAALGLAGVAVQSGAKSAIASLWSINDQATPELMDRFYSNWVGKSSLSKAEALRAAQVSILQAGGQTAHPAYWAPFLLVGNWL